MKSRQYNTARSPTYYFQFTINVVFTYRYVIQYVLKTNHVATKHSLRRS